MNIFFTFEYKKQIANGLEAERNTYIILSSVAERLNEEVSVKSHIDNFLENLLVNLQMKPMLLSYFDKREI